jgi:hypothetical protein
MSIMYEDWLDGRITGNHYDKMAREYDNQIYDFDFKMN